MIVKRLTEYANCAGCAGKIPPLGITQILSSLGPKSHDLNLLVGTETSDDAGVYLVADGLAIVQTVDFFPPLVDDPYTFGRIAATNALSDIYAMNARPITAMNLVMFPDDELPMTILGEIIRGGGAQVLEAGAVTLGGHSLRDKEIKFGLSVTGLVDPSALLTNARARVGDVLVLTKPLGTGLVTTAHKKQKCPLDVYDRAVAGMTQLNAVGPRRPQRGGRTRPGFGRDRHHRIRAGWSRARDGRGVESDDRDRYFDPPDHRGDRTPGRGEVLYPGE